MAKWTSLIVGVLSGGLARYVFSGAVYRVLGTGFPYGTLAVNLSGCFLIGVLDGLAVTKLMLGPNARLMLMTGFCGAYTTLSTLVLETDNLFRDGETAKALSNVAVSLVAGFILFRIGKVLCELI